MASHGARSRKGGSSVSKLKIFIPVLFAALVFGSVKTASGQGGDIYFNLGTAIDKSNGQSIDTFGDGTFRPTPKMTGLFGGFGGSFMFKPTIGFGAEFFSRFSQGGYAGLNYRPKFYDFNVVWMPIPKLKYVAPEFQAGIGGASLSFYLPPQCNSISCRDSFHGSILSWLGRRRNRCARAVAIGSVKNRCKVARASVTSFILAFRILHLVILIFSVFSVPSVVKSEKLNTEFTENH